MAGGELRRCALEDGGVMKIIRCVAVAIMFASVCGQLRAQSPQHQSKTNQSQSPATDQCGTEQSPLVVKVAPIPKTPAELDELARERERIAKQDAQKEESDTDLVKYTAELASFTKGLFYATAALVLATVALRVLAFFQSKDMKASIRVANVAANAADLTAKAAIGIELPIIRVNNLDINLLSIDADTNLEGPYACVVNDNLPTQHTRAPPPHVTSLQHV
jgi:hypothetical protein